GSASLTAHVLLAFAAGLSAFSVYLYALRGFYALADTRTPFLINAAENGINIVLAFVFERAFGVVGLGIAYSVAYTVGAVMATVVLQRRLGMVVDRTTALVLGRIALATGVMAAAVAAVRFLLDGSGYGPQLAAGVVVGVAVYAATVQALRVEEVHEIRTLVVGFVRR